MEIREITEYEYPIFSKIREIGFNSTYNPIDTYSEVFGYFDNEKMTSCMAGKQIQANFWGKSINMCGMGSIATLPEYRNKGQIRALMEYVLNFSYKRGDLIAGLHPFSHSFYRKFGFDSGRCVDYIEAHPSDLSQFKQSGSVKKYNQNDDFSDIKFVFEIFSKNRNFSRLRDTHAWKRRLLYSPSGELVQTYIHYGDDNSPSAYATIVENKSSYNFIEIAYVSIKALKSLLGYFSSIPNDIVLNIPLPFEIDPCIFFENSLDLKIKKECHDAFRIINAIECLKLYPWKENTDIKIKIFDSIIPQNNDTFLIKSTKNNLTVQRTELDEDASFNIGELGMLIFGCCDLKSLLVNRSTCRLNEKSKAVFSIFEKNPIEFNEKF